VDRAAQIPRGVGVQVGERRKLLAGFGEPLNPRDYGEHVVTLLTDPKYESATAVGISGEAGVQPFNL
jgi:hypothetical protein